jgi:ubiquinone/menaquinone biosynthesis C-methylase UbiE
MRASGGVSALAAASLLLFGCSGFTKLDYKNLFGRDGWQRPTDVIDVLAIPSGAWVADIGAGNGYFLPHLARAVGPEGRVFAVEVEDEPLAALEALVSEQGLANVELLRGRYEDPLLPDRKIDLVLIVNTYHHIEARPDYFRRLRGDLSDTGRVAVLDPNEELTGLFSLFLDEGHTSRAEDVRKEMREAGYREPESHDFLLTQIFEVFAPERP